MVTSPKPQNATLVLWKDPILARLETMLVLCTDDIDRCMQLVQWQPVFCFVHHPAFFMSENDNKRSTSIVIHVCFVDLLVVVAATGGRTSNTQTRSDILNGNTVQ